ncbi:MAG TPA: hypothetical protein PLU21_03935 [Candidatus Saccharibacteria bacterium]|nr:hypothetical protein [Candidatus Saccharibacteria bacterium]
MGSLPPTHKHHNPVFSLGVIVLGLMLILMFVLMTFQKPKTAPLADVGFVAYKPTKFLADNTSLEEKIVLIKEASFDYEHYSYQITYKPDNLKVYQEAAGEYAKIVAVCQTEAPLNDDYKYDCEVMSLPNGNRFKMQKSYYKGELFDVTVEALLGKTKLWFIVPDKLVEKYSKLDLQAYFESMKQADLSNVQQKTEVHKQGGG